ncbi:Hypothetical predicted protein [Pelobates cultripes]|uniref:Uncharacterized protein n=1 Tax=Pelobates cultripes TaxID=61616 RepID=A0AAD1RMQ4_PELCU|nr:Hypothetical predicted protein [Pelobates cultripes]
MHRQRGREFLLYRGQPGIMSTSRGIQQSDPRGGFLYGVLKVGYVHCNVSANLFFFRADVTSSQSSGAMDLAPGNKPNEAPSPGLK